MYFTDRGIEELDERRGTESVSLAWLADQMKVFVDLHPDHDQAIDAFASWLAREDASDFDEMG